MSDSPASSRPNLLLITTDQQRGDAIGYDGHPCVRTPHLDMLARESLVFSQAHVDCPICIPARTTAVTGIESHHYGCPSFTPGFRIDYPREKFLGSLLTAAGYQTCLIGKTHWHTDPSFTAGFEQLLSFDRYSRELNRHLGVIPSPGIGVNELSGGLSTLPQEWNKTTWAITEAIEFLQARDHSRPFCLWVSLLAPHPENVIHEPYYSMYDQDEIPDPVEPDWVRGEGAPYALQRLRIGNDHARPTRNSIRKSRGVYYGMITHIDHQLGRLFGELMRQALFPETAIFFTSDHGEQLFDHGFCFKGNFLDPSARVPFLARLPHPYGGPRGTASPALVQWADILPTLCDLAGATVPEDLDGRSLVPLLTGQTDNVRDFLHGQIGNQHLFHDGRYKYLYYADDGRELLFDKEQDRLDEHDLSDDVGLRNRLRSQLIEHLREEGHQHATADSQLVNFGKSIQPADRLNCLPWIGLSTTR